MRPSRAVTLDSAARKGAHLKEPYPSYHEQVKHLQALAAMVMATRTR